MTQRNKQNVWFVFAEVSGFSGQLEATRLIYANLDAARWTPRFLRLPSLDRSAQGMIRYALFGLRLAAALVRSVRLLLLRDGVVHVTLGQTALAFLREGFPLVLASAFRYRSKVVVSLNGSNFMEWPRASRMGRLFILLLSRAAVVTVLGNRQRVKLEEFGIPGDRIRIVPNSCEVSALSESEVARKHDRGPEVRVLFLSSLIDTKGYPEYLEALLQVSGGSGARIDAVLCGPVTNSRFNERFASAEEASTWIEEAMRRINDAGRVRIAWIPGAQGEAKWALFRAAHIFVLPSRYRVEAQPLVLVEAMAHGCAVVTSTIGEVCTILSETEARFLVKADAESVSQQIEALAADDEGRRRLGQAALTRFRNEYSLPRYMDRWDGILRGVADSSRRSEPSISA